MTQREANVRRSCSSGFMYDLHHIRLPFQSCFASMMAYTRLNIGHKAKVDGSDKVAQARQVVMSLDGWLVGGGQPSA